MLNESLITPKRIKIAVVCFVLLLVSTIIYVLATNLPSAGKVAVEIKYAPFEASVFIDDQNYAVNNAINYIEPGPHHITVTMNGFKTLEQDVEVTEETKYLYGSLETLSEDSNKVYQEYQTEYGAIEGIGGEESTQAAKGIVEEWPILRYLPYIKDDYTIGNILDNQNNLTVIVNAGTEQLNGAINKLRSFKDVTLSDYNIIIRDFDNVLDGTFVSNNNSDPLAFLRDGYQGVNVPFQVNEGQQSGDYYCTTISISGRNIRFPVTYRAILQKNGNSWQLVGTPYPILTTYNTPNVESSALDLANQIDAPISVQF